MDPRGQADKQQKRSDNAAQAPVEELTMFVRDNAEDNREDNATDNEDDVQQSQQPSFTKVRRGCELESSSCCANSEDDTPAAVEAAAEVVQLQSQTSANLKGKEEADEEGNEAKIRETSTNKTEQDNSQHSPKSLSEYSNSNSNSNYLHTSSSADSLNRRQQSVSLAGTRRSLSSSSHHPSSPIRTNSNHSRKLSFGNSNRVHALLEEENDTDDEEECQETLMMIAKARALYGDEYQQQQSKDETDTMSKSEDTKSGDNKKDNSTAATKSDEKGRIPRQARTGGAQEIQRPGAYSAAPGEGFMRNRSFQKDSFAMSLRSKREKKYRPSTSPSPQKNDIQEEEYDEGDHRLDRKPAAKPTKKTIPSDAHDKKMSSRIESSAAKNDKNKVTPPRERQKEMLQRFESPTTSDDEYESDMSALSQSSLTNIDQSTKSRTAPRRSVRRHRSLVHASLDDEDAAGADDIDNSNKKVLPTRGIRRQRPLPGRGSHATDDGNGEIMDDGSRRQNIHNKKSSMRFSALFQSFRSTTNSADGPSQQGSNSAMSIGSSSMRLSMLARSFRFRGANNSGMSLSGSFLSSSDLSSDKMISEIAEQSVSNFVRTFGNSMEEVLPIAATVVPSEEDLETLIRSRLETELRTHLSRELTSFRDRLFREVIQQGQLQVAEEVPMEGISEKFQHPLDDAGALPNQHSNASPFHISTKAPTALVEPLRGDGLNFAGGQEGLLSGNDGGGIGIGIPADDNDDNDDDAATEDQLTELVSSSAISSRRPRVSMLQDDFTRSIRESLRMELGNLGEELDLEQGGFVGEARVIDIESPPRSTARLTSSQMESQQATEESSGNQSGDTYHAGVESKQAPLRGLRRKDATMASRFKFSSRGLLGCLLIVFLMGAFVGAGSAILAMKSIQ